MKKNKCECIYFFLYHQKPLIGINGRVQSRVVEEAEEVRKNVMEIVAEKVTFLSSMKADE